MTTPLSKIWFHEFRPGGPRAADSAHLHNTVLNLWAEGKSKAEIADALEISISTVKKITWRARKKGDPRGFAKSKAIASAVTSSSSPPSDPVLHMATAQYVIRGLARAFGIPHSTVESVLRRLARELSAIDREEEASRTAKQV